MMWVAVFILIVLIAFAIAVATRPDSFRLERSIEIAAPPSVVFAYINDFREWTAWSPWEHIDSDLQRTYSGSDSGEGAAYSWSGKKSGEGNMLITTSQADNRIVLDLNFIKPFRAKNLTEFTAVPAGTNTHLTWAMSGRNTLMGRVIAVFSSMDKVVGKDFEKGLANLKRISESRA